MASDKLDEKAIFNVARQISAADVRADYLGQVCQTDPVLRERVELLLRGYEAQSSFLETVPTAALPPTRDLGPIEQPGSMIGPYKLLQEIGHGGMGVVYLAEQVAPVRRKVALKIIKPGLDTRQVVARFEAERQALSLMDHPNIARVLDAGATASGRPFFVMELVKGQPITQFCDERQLSLRQRLELFLPVCAAIQHAHQKGIIHRDVKPSNVLIAEYDGQPVAKVIDFGIAKAVSQPLTEKTMFTGFGQIIGTLEYMSPEQARVNQLDVDTRSDIYSLGVLLYELLTGSTPLDKLRLRSAGWDEMLRIIREEEPPKPSTRLADSQDSLPSISAQRHSEPAQLTRIVRGDLDWIVMKALDKDRNRRYETASSLATDLQRYLADEPVQAGPPSAMYKLRKFVRRNRRQAAALAALGLTLILGSIGTTAGMLRAIDERRGAEQARQAEATERQKAEQRLTRALAAEQLADKRRAEANDERQRATEEARIASAVSNLLLNKLLSQADVGQQSRDLRISGDESAKLNPNITVRELLERAADELAPDRIGQIFPEQPIVQAKMLETIGLTFFRISAYERAVELLDQAAEKRAEAQGPRHIATLLCQKHAAAALSHTSRVAEALEPLRRIASELEAVAGASDPAALAARNDLAVALVEVGQYDEAITNYQTTLTRCEEQLGARAEMTMNVRYNLAAALMYDQQSDAAIELFERVLADSQAVRGPQDPWTLKALNGLAMAHDFPSKRHKALNLYQQVLEAQEKVCGPTHHDTLTTLGNLGNVYRQMGQLDRAISILETAVQKMSTELSRTHPTTLNSIANLALAYDAAGRVGEAFSLVKEAYETCRQKLGSDHRTTLRLQANLGGVCWRQKKYELSIPVFEDLLVRYERRHGRSHGLTLLTMANLGSNYCSAGRSDEGLALLEEAYQKGAENKDLDWVRDTLATFYAEFGRPQDAVRVIRDELEGVRQRVEPDSVDLVWGTFNAGRKLLIVKQRVAAEPHLREALELAERRQKQNVPTIRPIQFAIFRSHLGEALMGSAKWDEAEAMLDMALVDYRRSWPEFKEPSFYHLSDWMKRVVELYDATNRPELAAKWRTALESFHAPATPHDERDGKVRDFLAAVEEGRLMPEQTTEWFRENMFPEGVAGQGRLLQSKGPIAAWTFLKRLELPEVQVLFYRLKFKDGPLRLIVFLDDQDRLGGIMFASD